MNRVILFFCLLLLLVLTNCGEEEIAGRTQINLSNTSIYERLPANSNVALLSTDFSETRPTFRLVSGEGDTDNSDFVIKGTILQTTKSLLFADGASRSLRIQVSGNMETFERAVEIKIN
ncbi:MAG: hypothetical protein AAGJ18_25615, partial [Bacteroidota bacterium]